MNRFGTLLMALLVVASAGVWTAVPASGASSGEKTADGATFTVETGSIHVEPGGRICAKVVDGNTNEVILEDVNLTDVTVYLTADSVQQRTDISSADVEERMVLYTNGENQKVDTLATSGRCITTDQKNVVLDSYHVESSNLSTTDTQIVVGEDVAEGAPAPGGFQLPPRYNDGESEVASGVPVGAPGPSDNVTEGTDPAGEVTDTANETNTTVGQVTNATNDTVDDTTDTVQNMTNRARKPLNDTTRAVDNTTNSTTDDVDKTVDNTADTVSDTTDVRSDATTTTTAETRTAKETERATPTDGGSSDDGLSTSQLGFDPMAKVLC